MLDPILLTGVALVVLGVGEKYVTIGAGAILIVYSLLA